MSSISGGSDEGGINEDVEADESTRTEHSRAENDLPDILLSSELGVGQEQAGQDGGEDALVDDPPERQEGINGVEEDYLDLNAKEDLHVDDVDAVNGAAGAARKLRSPLASPTYSESIPDDTPSLRGSLLSSPGRARSPMPRTSFGRVASGALQPFERRFEARTPGPPLATPRVGSPAFLSPHSRQVSLFSQISKGSSQGDSITDTPEAPWDVIRWTKLRKISGQAFSEIGKRNFGRPTCLAVSALIAIGTSKGLILGFDYHQTLKIIIGQGTKATECGSVTAISIAADYSTVACGHANGHIFTWEISKPAKPFLQLPPLGTDALRNAKHGDGHVEGCAILHIGFLATRHTALVSADAAGMAFCHLATRGLGSVSRTIKTTRLLGRYPVLDDPPDRNRKASSVLAFSPLPLGNVEQATDTMGLTALLTPYLLVIVSTTPIAQTQHKRARPKELSAHSTLSGCLAWFPAVRLKGSSEDEERGNSNTKLVYCWSNVLTILDVHATENENPAKPASLTFKARKRWQADEAIVAVQWLSRSVLGILTVSQRLLIVEDGSLQVTDSIDLLQRHIYHQDLFSEQLRSVVETTDSIDPSLHGVVADAFYMSLRSYKGRVFLLGVDDLTVGALSNWADRLMALMEAGDHVAAIRLATEYYAGSATNVTVGLPDDDRSRHSMVKERLLGMASASLNYTFAQHDDDRDLRLRELADACFEACTGMGETSYLFGDIFDIFDESEEQAVFIRALEPYILDDEIKILPPEVVRSIVEYFISENQAIRLEELLCRLDPTSFDLDQITTLCRQHSLYNALIYVWTQGIGDFVTPLIDLLTLVRLLQEGDDDGDMIDDPYFESAMKVFPFLAYALTGRWFPSGVLIEDNAASQTKADLYEYIFAATTVTWPAENGKPFQTRINPADEPAFPHLVLLLEFDTASFMSMLNEAFEDSFLNESDQDLGSNGVNGTHARAGFKMTRQHIISIMLDVVHQNDFDKDQIIYLDMFIARSLPKFPGQLVLTGTLLSAVLQRLCRPPSAEMRDDCQLSVEYLLSAYRPPDVHMLTEWLQRAHFHRVLKTVFRGEGRLTELLTTYFEDPDDKDAIFDCVTYCLRPGVAKSQKQIVAVKRTILEHITELAEISVVQTAHTLATSSSDILEPALDALQDANMQFVFLRTLLEPSRLHEASGLQALMPQDQRPFTERYVRLMCAHDPGHVADYVGSLPTSDLRLDQVLPAMEESGVIDAAVVLLARDGLARDAMERLIAHLGSLLSALTSLIQTADRSPDWDSTNDSAVGLVEDVQKYTKVGIWLAQGQSATVQRRPQPRHASEWNVSEDDLDLDEFLWLSLVDTAVHVSKETNAAVQQAHDLLMETTHDGDDFTQISTMLRTNVQQAFSSLLAATAASVTKTNSVADPRALRKPDNLSFLRILRAFLTRAAASAPSLADLRAVLADIFSAYAFEQGVLSLANELLGSDVFTDIQEAVALRQRGWRPRTQVCEHCKRRAWGPGVGEVIWEEWVAREQEREAGKARKMVERGGGEEARRMERGKAKEKTAADLRHVEESNKLTLVVFACRHVFHRTCLDPGYGSDRAMEEAMYRCPLCSVEN